MIKALDKWFPGYVTSRLHQSGAEVTDLIVAVCDHFEPFHDTDKSGALERIKAWKAGFKAVQHDQPDADGVLPRHTFFYPIEQYDADVVGALEDMARTTANEVEIHLHHEGETREELREVFRAGVRDFERHGFLARDGEGASRFCFIHGNWALDDANMNGKGCGVRDELALLREEGCMADMTMPSAPHPTQSRIVNQIYYSESTPSGRSFDRGVRSGPGTQKFRHKMDHLLLIQGPLGPDWRSRKWGVLPRIENGDLTNNNPPSVRRAHGWMQLAPAVEGAEGWRFVKLHTHGALERNQSVLITDAARNYHRELREHCDGAGIRLHYVSAREMVNIVHAAEDGKGGDAGAWRDYLYSRPPLLEEP
jgi:hypothetical protein